MKNKNVLIISISLLIVVVGLIVFRSTTSDAKIIENRTRHIIESLNAGNYQGAMRDYSEIARAQATPDRFRQGWSSIVAGNGSFKNLNITRTGAEGDPRFVCFTCEFEKGVNYGCTVFNNSNEVIGFGLFDTPEGVRKMIGR